MDNKSLEILYQVAYKAVVELSNANKVPFSWEKVEEHFAELVKRIQTNQSKFGTPFQNKPANAPRGSKVVGEPCKDCGTPYTQGAKGAYCKPCYITWKNSNK